MTVALALNYGGRAEIVDAVKGLLREKSADPEALTEESFARHLYTASLPGPRPPHPDERRDADLQFPALADRLRGDLDHARPLAGLPEEASSRSPLRISDQGKEVRRRPARLSRTGPRVAIRPWNSENAPSRPPSCSRRSSRSSSTPPTSCSSSCSRSSSWAPWRSSTPSPPGRSSVPGGRSEWPCAAVFAASFIVKGFRFEVALFAGLLLVCLYYVIHISDARKARDVPPVRRDHVLRGPLPELHPELHVHHPGRIRGPSSLFPLRRHLPRGHGRLLHREAVREGTR